MVMALIEEQYMCLVLGPEGSGKTVFLKRLQSKDARISFSSSAIPTVGTNVTNVAILNGRQIYLREVGGQVLELWHNYCKHYKNLIFVIDASNPFQIAASYVNLQQLLRKEQFEQVLVVLSKTDLSTKEDISKMRSLLNLSSFIQDKEISISVVHVSAVENKGMQKVNEWLQTINKTPVPDKDEI